MSWSTFATGLNPGRTEIFDFLKRDPAKYSPRFCAFDETHRRPLLAGESNRWAFAGVGLTAAFVPELTRDAVYDAIRGRKVYAATCSRVYLDVQWTQDGAAATADIKAASEEGVRDAVLVHNGGDAATLWTAPNRVFAGIMDTFLEDDSAPGPLTFYSVVKE